MRHLRVDYFVDAAAFPRILAMTEIDDSCSLVESKRQLINAIAANLLDLAETRGRSMPELARLDENSVAARSQNLFQRRTKKVSTDIWSEVTEAMKQRRRNQVVLAYADNNAVISEESHCPRPYLVRNNTHENM